MKRLGWVSLVASLPNLLTHARKEGEPGILNHVRDVGQDTTVGSVEDHENARGRGQFSSSLVQRE